MASCTWIEKTQQQPVGMGQVLVVRKPDRLTAVLGSCVGVALFHPRLRVGALGHIVLPQSSGADGAPGKFADLAIPHMLRLLEGEGALRSGLVAKLAGGACMFGGSGPLQIGEANVAAAIRLLSAAGIRIAGKDVGGTKGRRVTLDGSSGELLVEIAGRPPCTL